MKIRDPTEKGEEMKKKRESSIKENKYEVMAAIHNLEKITTLVQRAVETGKEQEIKVEAENDLIKISNSANKEERAHANRHFLKLTCDWMQELAKMAYIIPKEENFRIEIESNSEDEEMTMKLILLDGTQKEDLGEPDR